MIDPVRELKIRADHLQRAAEAGDPDALARLPGVDRQDVQRKHCLAALAREHGFSGWAHATRVLGGDPEERDFGTLLYPREGAPYPNLWLASYEEARAVLDERGGYLVPHRTHFVVATTEYVEALGLDPNDPDWDAIGHDWVKPRDAEARSRLYGKLLAR